MRELRTHRWPKRIVLVLQYDTKMLWMSLISELGRWWRGMWMAVDQASTRAEWNRCFRWCSIPNATPNVAQKSTGTPTSWVPRIGKLGGVLIFLLFSPGFLTIWVGVGKEHISMFLMCFCAVALEPGRLYTLRAEPPLMIDLLILTIMIYKCRNY